MAWRISTWWKRTNEGLRGARFVLPCLTQFCQFPLSRCCCFGVCWWVGVWFCLSCCFSCRPGELLHPISFQNRDPEAHNGKVIQTATHPTWSLAEYLADTIAWLMRSILDHASKILFDNDTEPLLTPSFWILPLIGNC